MYGYPKSKGMEFTAAREGDEVSDYNLINN